MKTFKQILVEANYIEKHKTYSGACQEALRYVKSLGLEPTDAGVFGGIALGPGKPKPGKSIRHSLPLTKNGKAYPKFLQFQVYNNDNGKRTVPAPYELNLYIN